MRYRLIIFGKLKKKLIKISEKNKFFFLINLREFCKEIKKILCLEESLKKILKLS